MEVCYLLALGGMLRFSIEADPDVWSCREGREIVFLARFSSQDPV